VDESVVSEPRVLAVRATPAEAAPMGNVSYEALWVDADGPVIDAPLTFHQCLARKPLAELGPVSQECLRSESEDLVLLGTGVEAQGSIVTNACELFGPTPPTPEPGEPPGRPVDADTTGGYSLPLRVTGPGVSPVFFEQRIRCPLPGAGQLQSAELTRRYRRNENPEIERVELVHENGDAVDLDVNAPTDVSRGERVTLRVHWPACPIEAECGDGVCSEGEDRFSCRVDCIQEKGCKGKEAYVFFDPQSREIVERSEAIRVAWFTSDGRLQEERTGVEEASDALDSENTFTAPGASGDVNLWIVLRDSRGGVGWQQLQLHVTE
jgi:hypothetical protein